MHHMSACYTMVEACGPLVFGAMTLLLLVIHMAVSQSTRKTLQYRDTDAEVVHPSMEEEIVPWRRCGQDGPFPDSSADWW